MRVKNSFKSIAVPRDCGAFATELRDTPPDPSSDRTESGNTARMRGVRMSRWRRLLLQPSFVADKWAVDGLGARDPRRYDGQSKMIWPTNAASIHSRHAANAA
jgi:hypothetical protein